MSLAAVAVAAGLALPQAVPVQVTPQPASPSLESLAREGFEIKAIQTATSRGMGYVVMLQRGPEVRTCLMRIAKGADGRPAKQSVCF